MDWVVQVDAALTSPKIKKKKGKENNSSSNCAYSHNAALVPFSQGFLAKTNIIPCLLGSKMGRQSYFVPGVESQWHHLE